MHPASSKLGSNVDMAELYLCSVVALMPTPRSEMPRRAA
jgi:hypothetical protein